MNVVSSPSIHLAPAGAYTRCPPVRGRVTTGVRAVAVGLDLLRPLRPRGGVAAGAGAPRAAARLPRLHGRQLDRAGAPACRGCSKALGCQAIGGSRGGPSTKLHAIEIGRSTRLNSSHAN